MTICENCGLHFEGPDAPDATNCPQCDSSRLHHLARRHETSKHLGMDNLPPSLHAEDKQRQRRCNAAACASVPSMTPQDALRFAAYEADECRDLDAHEALCLLFPALLRALSLPPMDEFEAEAFRYRLKQQLAQR